MAALLAHALNIHFDQGRLAAPHEVAHVAFRLARNFVHAGELAWSFEPTEGGLGSYPSPILVAVAIVAERLYLTVTTFCQWVGMIAALLTVGLSASFATNRIGGVIPPLLLVASGGVAAAAVSGTEVPLVMLFLAASFVAFEHRWPRRFAIALALLVVARPEGAVMAAAFLGLGLLERVIARRDGAAALPLVTYLPAGVFAVLLLLPLGGDSVYGPLLADLFAVDGERAGWGLAYIRDAAVTAATPLLLVFPLVFLLAGRLSGAGARALALAVLWAGLIVLEGGGPLPFSLAVVPTLPLVFIAVQQGLLAALDTHKVFLEYVGWVTLVAAICLTALASKYPGDLGPLRTDEWHRAWMADTSRTPYGRRPILGRAALDDEIRLTRDMRNLAIFLRENIEPGHTLLTPWPGALGYLSGMKVYDLFARTTAPPGEDPNPFWPPRPPVDVLAALAHPGPDEVFGTEDDELRPDYILPGRISKQAAAHALLEFRITRELLALDAAPTRERSDALRKILEKYELVTLPVSGRPFYMLRKRSLGKAPRLSIELNRDRIVVEARSEGDEAAERGHPQLAQLLLHGTDEQGHAWSFRPTGELTLDTAVYARTGLMLAPGSERAIQLFESALPTTPDGLEIVELRATLLNPGTLGDHRFALVCEEVTLPLR